MADTPTPGETATQGNSETKVQTQAPAQGNASEQALAEARKEAEQARMRANQLENELKKKAEAEAEAERKRLEEQNEWKTVAEQERARREELEKTQEERTRKEELQSATNEVLSEYPDAVKEIAAEAGLSALDNSEEAKAAFKEKLEKIKAKLPQVEVGANNPANPSQTTNKLSGDDMKLALKNENNFHDLASKLPGVQAMLTKRQ